MPCTTRERRKDTPLDLIMPNNEAQQHAGTRRTSPGDATNRPSGVPAAGYGGVPSCAGSPPDADHHQACPHAENQRDASRGVSNALILRNLARLGGAGAEVIARVPVIPEHNDSPGEIEAIACAARERGVTSMTLLPFNPAAPGKYAWLRRPYPLEGTQRQTDEEMAEFERIVEAAGLTVVRA